MKPLKQNDIITVDICDNGMEGEGIARIDDYTVFVPFCLKGERVKIKLNHVKRNVAFADLVEVELPSPDRKTPPCNRFGKCGGCDLMHANYKTQLEIKRNNLMRLLKKNAAVDFEPEPIEPCSLQYGYRNKIQLPFGYIAQEGRVTLGFYRKNSHRVVAITKCFLHGDWAEKLIGVFLDYANGFRLSVYDEASGKGHLKHLVARYIDGKISIVVVTDSQPLRHTEYLINRLSELFDDFSLYQSKKPEKTNVVMGKTLIPIKTSPFVIDVLGIKTDLNPYSFLQLNDEIRDKIYSRIISEISSSSVVIDAYAGVGTLGAVLAKNGCCINNIEIVKEATADGDRLAAQNGLSDRINNINGDAAIVLPSLINKILGAQNTKKCNIAIILDPPRKGCGQRVLDAINSLDVNFSLHYISCNPATLTRDLKILLSSGKYTLSYIKPYDMFPNTSHVETLVRLTKKI